MNNEFPRVLAHVYVNHRAKWLYQNAVTECYQYADNVSLERYGWFSRESFFVRKPDRWFESRQGDVTWIKKWKRMLMNNDGCYESGIAPSWFQGGDVRYLNPMTVCPRCEILTESDTDGFPRRLRGCHRIQDMSWFDEAWQNASLRWFNPVLCETCKTIQDPTLDDLARDHYNSIKTLRNCTDRDIDMSSSREPYRSALLYHATQRRKDRISEYWARRAEAARHEAEVQKRKEEIERANLQIMQRYSEYMLRKHTRKQPSKSVINFFQMSNALATIAKHEQNHTTNAD